MTDPFDGEIRSMVATLVESGPLPPPFPTRPIPGTRRRPWRAMVAVALAVLVIAALGYAAATQTSSTKVATGPGRSPADQFIVVDDGSGRTTLINSNSGSTRVVELPHRTGGDFPYAILATGGYFVYVGSDGTWATPANLKGSPRNLGSASYIVPSSTPGRVWLVTDTTSGQSAPARAQEVAVDGRYRGPVRSVPSGDAVVTGATGGVVLDTTDGAALWNPGTGQFSPTIVGAHRSNLIDVQGSKLAWVGCATGGACTTVHVADLASGHSRDYSAPPGTSRWISTGGEGLTRCLLAGRPIPRGASNGRDPRDDVQQHLRHRSREKHNRPRPRDLGIAVFPYRVAPARRRGRVTTQRRHHSGEQPHRRDNPSLRPNPKWRRDPDHNRLVTLSRKFFGS